MIRGGTEDENTIREMWARWIEATSALQVPFFKVVGNHDVWSKKSEALYREIFDEPLYYSFDYGGSHFVVLDTEFQEAPHKISGEQLNWLEKDLSDTQGAESTFVFLHRPLWLTDPEGWAPIHRLLLDKGIDAVFGGHYHIYAAQQIDGIHYIITGGAGAPVGSRGEVIGNFLNYCLVSVSPDAVSIAVIKPGSIEPEDVVLAEDLPRAKKIASEWIGDPKVDLSAAGEKKPVSLEIRNLSSEPVSGEVHWDLDGCGWCIEPASTSYSAPAGATTTLQFLATPPRGNPTAVPNACVTFPLRPGRSFTIEKALVILGSTNQ
jgi:predicted phosphodiesterase